MVTEYQKKVVKNKIKGLLDVTKSLYGFDIKTDVRFGWDSRFPTAAGRAIQYRLDGVIKNLLYFNQYYLINQTTEFVERTVPHEVAHLIIYEHQNRGLLPEDIDSHGKEFQKVMISLGATDVSAKHNYNIKVIPGFESGSGFKCGDCGANLRVSDLQAKNIHKFHCSKCGSKNIIKI